VVGAEPVVGGGGKAGVGGAGGGNLPGVAEAGRGTEQRPVDAVALVPQSGAGAVVQGGGAGAQDLPELVLLDLRPEVQEGVGDSVSKVRRTGRGLGRPGRSGSRG